MKRLGAVLIFSALAASRAAAQVTAPTPPPVQSFPLRVQTPQQYAPAKDYSPENLAPPIETMPMMPVVSQSAMPPLRVPESYSAPYNAPVTETCNVYQGSHGLTNVTCGGPGCCNQGGCSSCGGCGVCGPAGRIWGEFDYIFWSARGDKVPPLVTTSPTGTPAVSAGVLGTPGVAVLAGSAGYGDQFRSGFRYNIGGWFNEAQTFGLQFGGFLLNDATNSFAISSNGDPIVSRPFVNALTGAQASQLVALPGILAGGVGVDHTNAIIGFDAALRGNMCCNSCYRLDALLGWRYFRMQEGLAVTENLTAGPAAPLALGVPAGTGIIVRDGFVTTNTFNGVQTGIAGEWRFWDRFFFSGTAKASFGWIDLITDTVGATTVTTPGAVPTIALGGLLVQSSNFGRHSQTDAVIIPEVNANLGLQLTPNVRLRAGYNFLYVSSVVRPGGVIDTAVNPALIPPAVGNPLPARPAIQPRMDDFFLHGINAGVEVRF